MATMRPIRETIALDDALALILASAAPIDRTERLPLLETAGRVVSAPLVAAMDVPPFDRAAMDGYAVRAEDTFGAGRSDPKTLQILETIYTGQAPTRRVDRGACAEVATGAPMPPGADAVVMVEETERAHDDTVRILNPVFPGQHVGRQGADIKTGDAVVSRGEIVNPSRIGALAAIGARAVEVFARPRIALLSTGNEIVEPGETLGPGRIYDINRFTLASIVAAHGGEPVSWPTVPDTLEALSRAIDTALPSADVLVFSGGSSVGERDLILDVLAARGEVMFHGVAVKPGKPTAFARVGATPALGLSGYPTSCLANAYMLLVPLLRRIARLPEYHPEIRRLPLARRIVSTTGRRQFYTVRIHEGAAVPAFKASGDITSMAHADGYIDIPAQVDILEAGELVDVRLF